MEDLKKYYTQHINKNETLPDWESLDVETKKSFEKSKGFFLFKLDMILLKFKTSCQSEIQKLSESIKENENFKKIIN